MKEFLEKVPKLADLPKVMWKGKEVIVMCFDPDNKTYVIRFPMRDSTLHWVDEADLKFQTHWDRVEAQGDSKMKEITLEKVPKLADLTKARYLGEEVHVLCFDHKDKTYAIHTDEVKVIWVGRSALKFQTHWDASEFHQFFVKHPMEECIAYNRRGGQFCMQGIVSITLAGLQNVDEMWFFENIESIAHDKSGRVECLKEAVG